MKKGLYRLVGLHTIDSRNQLIWCCLGCKGQWKYERKIFWPEMHAFLVRICGLNLETSLQIYRIQWMAHRVLWVKPELWGFLWALHYSLRVTEPSWNATHIHPRGVAANPLRLSCRWDAGPQMTPPPLYRGIFMWSQRGCITPFCQAMENITAFSFHVLHCAFGPTQWMLDYITLGRSNLV